LARRLHGPASSTEMQFLLIVQLAAQFQTGKIKWIWGGVFKRAPPFQ